jgi:cytidyltransferase-like protein
MLRVYGNAQELKVHLPPEKTFTLVGGAFDLIHIGHVNLLRFASTLQGLLVVCVLSDKAIRDYKEQNRPILDEQQRAEMVASIRYVDFVYISDSSPSSVNTLTLLQPHSVVFGDDPDNISNVQRWSERIQIHSPNTKISLLPRYLGDEISTSRIIDRIKGG